MLAAAAAAAAVVDQLQLLFSQNSTNCNAGFSRRRLRLLIHR